MPLYAIVILATISIAVLAFVLNRIMMRRQRAATPPGVYEDEPRIDEEGHSIRDALRFMIGPFPLSIALHVLLLLILIATIKVQNARDLLMVTLQQVGGGGGSKHDEMRDVDMPDLTMPDTMPQMVVPKVAPRSRAPRCSQPVPTCATCPPAESGRAAATGLARVRALGWAPASAALSASSGARDSTSCW